MLFSVHTDKAALAVAAAIGMFLGSVVGFITF